MQFITFCKQRSFLHPSSLTIGYAVIEFRNFNNHVLIVNDVYLSVNARACLSGFTGYKNI